MDFKRKSFRKALTILGLLSIGAIILAVSSLREAEILPSSEFNDESKNTFNPKFSLRDSLDLFGKDLLGIPYSYAGTSREGFDCSGFVFFVFENFSIEVPRSTSQFEGVGKNIAIESVKKGDLLLFLSPTRNEIGHIGIVTKPKGMETEFIHASSGKEMKVIISSLKQPNYNRRFVKAISVIED